MCCASSISLQPQVDEARECAAEPKMLDRRHAGSAPTPLDKRGDAILRKHLGTWSHDRSAPHCCDLDLTRQHGKHGSATTTLLGPRRASYTAPGSLRSLMTVCCD
jgi:hypothetical protein